MGGLIFLAVMGGMLASRVLFGLRRRAWMRHGGHGGGCAAYDGAHGWQRGRWRRHGGAGATVPAPAAPVDMASLVDSVLAKLELNARQGEEARDVFAAIADALGSAYRRWNVPAALAVVGTEPFDAARAADLFELPPAASKVLVDALEHLHNILTPEQRAQLAALGRGRV